MLLLGGTGRRQHDHGHRHRHVHVQPVLAIVGAPIQRWYGRGQLQETSRPDTAPADQAFMQMLQPITKRVWSIADPRTIPTAVRKAFTAAQVGRPGPVGLEIPWDLRAAEVDTLPEDPDAFPARARRELQAHLLQTIPGIGP